jgi:hypothetical protein
LFGMPKNVAGKTSASFGGFLIWGYPKMDGL